jgi:hypothetical protein
MPHLDSPQYYGIGSIRFECLIGFEVNMNLISKMSVRQTFHICIYLKKIRKVSDKFTYDKFVYVVVPRASDSIVGRRPKHKVYFLAIVRVLIARSIFLCVYQSTCPIKRRPLSPHGRLINKIVVYGSHNMFFH